MRLVRALVYTRVSEDRANGRSVAEQEVEARRVCELERWDVAHVVTDSVGASRHSKGQRSGWQQATTILEAGGVDVLVTWEASRAQRDLSAYAELRDLCARTGILWSYSGRTYDLRDHQDRFTTGLDALLAEREAEETAMRVRRAVRANALAGRPHGRRLYGYRRIYDDRTGQLIGQEPEPDEAAVIRSMFARFLDGDGTHAIRSWLAAEGIRTGSGVAWDHTQIRRALSNPSYTALRVHQGEIVGEADWPAIIDRTTWEQVQDRLAARQWHRVPSTTRLLSTVARCGVCGGVCRVLGDRKIRKVYVCRERSCVARDERKLDDYVTGILLDRIGRIDRLEPDESMPADVAQLQAAIAALEKRLDDAAQQFAAGDLSAPMLARVERTIAAELAERRAALRRLTVPHHLEVPTGDPGEWWDGLARERRREYMEAFFDAVVIHRTRRGERTFDPSRIEVIWR